MERNRRPPDVEEALSSMLWTPYPRTPTDSSDDEDANVPKHTNKSKVSPPAMAAVNSISRNIASADDNGNNSPNGCNNLYGPPSVTGDNNNLFPSSIRYQSNYASNYGRFMPKSFNSCNRQLPSYEHIEKERLLPSLTNAYGIGMGSIAACATNGIYLIPAYSACTTTTTTTMVHSFTDNFIQYQVTISYENFTIFFFCFSETKQRLRRLSYLCIPFILNLGSVRAARHAFAIGSHSLIKGQCLHKYKTVDAMSQFEIIRRPKFLWKFFRNSK